MTDEEQQKVVSSRLHAMFDGGNMQAVISRNCLLTRPETEAGLLAVTANHSNNTVSHGSYGQTWQHIDDTCRGLCLSTV